MSSPETALVSQDLTPLDRKADRGGYWHAKLLKDEGIPISPLSL